MIKFSRAGWNNIIIFAVMGFILLINVTHDNVFSIKKQLAQEQYLVGENTVILTLTINQQIKVERIGKTWRSTPTSMNNQALEQMMHAWQQSIGEKISPPDDIDPQLGLIVELDLAGQASSMVLSLHIHQEQLLVFNHDSKRWLAFAMPIYNQLIPEQLFELSEKTP